MTSAGARIKQDAISATPEAAEWTKGCGSGVALPITCFALSYVEKNRPAAIYEPNKSSYPLIHDIPAGRVASTTLPMPW
jgi:hypothetical protein